MDKIQKKIQEYITRYIQKASSSDDARYIFILAGIVLLTTVGLIVWFSVHYFFGGSGRQGLLDPTPGETEVVEECDYRRKLDGVCVRSPRYTDPDLVAVMIENSFDAWPFSGLSAASIVYEAPVEGNIPRFMAVYPADVDLDRLGPVRSARPYYLDWLSEYGDAMYMHVGGSPEALEKIGTYGLFNLNEFYRGRYYWRDTSRTAPHNVYTSSKLWQKARKDYSKFHEEKGYDGWVFETRDLCEENCVDEVTAKLLSPTYDARWVFSSSTGQYQRYQNRTVQTDIDGTPIVADTVIVQRMKVQTIDAIGRKQIDTIGSGDATIFRDGYMIGGTWEKASRTDRTQFYDSDGNIIPLRPGKIWIEILSLTSELETE